MNRLTTEQVAVVMQDGKAAQGRFFLIRYIINPKGLVGRFGKVSEIKKDGPSGNPKQFFASVASKKIFKTAVLRNKAKRRVREALQGLELPPVDLWCVVLVRADVFDVTTKDFSEELTQVLRKQGILGTNIK